MKSISMQLGIPDSQPRRRDVGSWNVRLNSPMLDDGPGGVRRLLSGGEDRIRADVSAASGFGPLACELYLGCSAFADAAPHLVVHLAGRISRALGGAIAESRSTLDDFVLVHQQLVRSSDQRGPDALSRWRTDSLQKPSRSRHFLSLRSTSSVRFCPRFWTRRL